MKRLTIIGLILLTHCAVCQKIEIDPVQLTMKEGTAYPVTVEVSQSSKATAPTDHWVEIKLSGDSKARDFAVKSGTTVLDITVRQKLTIATGTDSEKLIISIEPLKDGKEELVEIDKFEFILRSSATDMTDVSKTTLDATVLSYEKASQERIAKSLNEYYPMADEINVFLGGGLKLNNKTIFDSFAFELFFRNPELASLSLSKGKWKVGMFGGLYFYTYNITDSTKYINTISKQLDPLNDNFGVGDKYIAEVRSNSASITRASYGGYVDFIFAPDQEDDFRVALSVHVEVARASSKFVSSSKVVISDTLIYKANGPVVAKYDPISSSPVYKQSIDGYFGIGIPISTLKAKKYDFFFHPIIGYTTFSPANYNYSIPDFIQISRQQGRVMYPFYLVKAQLTEQATGLGISLGSEIRGIFDKDNFYDPALVFFVASKINISKLVGK